MQKSQLTKILVFAILTFFSFKTIYACQGSIPPVCEAFGQSKNVFAGKLIKVEKIEVDGRDVLNAEFQVSKTYKGKVKNTHFIKFSISDCGITLVEGKNYLVYEDREILWAYNRTRVLEYSKDDIEYIESLSQEKPQYMIFGQLQTYLDEKLKGVRIFIEEEENTYEVSLDKDYNFSFKTAKPGKYRLKIIVPFDAEFGPGDYSIVYTPKVTSSSEQTIAEAEFEFRPNDCNYVEYFISKKKDN